MRSAFAEAPASGSLVEDWKDLWDLATLYESEQNPLIRKVAFTGRFQWDYAHIDGEGTRPSAGQEENLHFDEFDIRRFRGGLKVGMAEGFTLHCEVDIDPEEDPVYQRLTEASLAWEHSEALRIKVGKQGMDYTLDGSTSSKELLTIDRNNLSNNLWFTNEYMPGITVGGSKADWVYRIGLFSQGGEDGEFGDFDGGPAFCASLGRDISRWAGIDEATVVLDWMWNEKNSDDRDLFTNRSFGQVLSLHGSFQEGPAGFRADLAAGDGFLGQADAAGVVLMPFYEILPDLQLVGRYTRVASDGDNGLRFSNYESRLMEGARGDLYQEWYLGLNRYFNGHKLKVQSGLAWIDMEDAADDGGAFEGLSWITALRISW